jgi:hypothetical protein
VFCARSSASNGQSPEQYLHLHVASGNLCAQCCRDVSKAGLSGKAEEYARRTVLAKSHRDSRRYRKLAEIYRALALGEEPESVQSPKKIAKRAQHDGLSLGVSQTFGAEMGGSCPGADRT